MPDKTARIAPARPRAANASRWRGGAAAGLILALATLQPQPGRADFVYADDVIVDGRLCAGRDCISGENFDDESIKVKYQRLRILFDDTTTLASFPSRDWEIWVNDIAQYGLDRFSVRDVTANTLPFSIQGAAPENALFVSAAGDLGLGTALPAAGLHLVRGSAPALRLEQDSSAAQTPQTWQISADDSALAVEDITGAGARPLRVFTGSAEDTLVLRAGFVGLGTALPQARLHITGAGDASARLVDSDPATAPRTLLALQNNGRPEIVMGNSFTNGEWSFGAGTNFVLKQGAVGSASAAKTKYLTLFAGSGDLEISGQIITGGTTCGGGCDLVFSEGYDLPSISEHAKAMFALGYLPNVGPTAANQPINLSDKLGRMLNELEHAHIYIAELEQKLAQQTDSLRATQAQQAELRALVNQLLD